MARGGWLLRQPPAHRPRRAEGAEQQERGGAGEPRRHFALYGMAGDARAELLVDLLHLVGRLRAERLAVGVAGDRGERHRIRADDEAARAAEDPTAEPAAAERSVVRAQRDSEDADAGSLRAVRA